MRVVLAGGGTGGHVIPALAIARELQVRYAAEICFIGTPRGIENKLVPAAGFDLQLIKVGALKNVGLATRARTLFDLPRAVLRCWRLFGRMRPDVVIGVGGYASGPGMLAAWSRGIPTLAFEPNVVPGFANRAVSRLVTAAAVHFEETKQFFRNPRVTGVPVRPEFFSIAPRPAGSPPVLLVFGGSQGASAINQAVMSSLGALEQALPSLRIIHQTGERDFEAVRAAYARTKISSEVSPFILDMPRAFARADLLLCRSGASTVAEVTAAGKPAIFIPFPRAADDHQLRNAESLSALGAAQVLPESRMTSGFLAGTITNLLRNPEQLAEMGKRARALAHPTAAGEIAEMAANLAQVQASKARPADVTT